MAMSLFENVGTSMSAACPLVCCDFELDPTALLSLGLL